MFCVLCFVFCVCVCVCVCVRVCVCVCGWGGSAALGCKCCSDQGMGCSNAAVGGCLVRAHGSKRAAHGPPCSCRNNWQPGAHSGGQTPPRQHSRAPARITSCLAGVRRRRARQHRAGAGASSAAAQGACLDERGPRLPQDLLLGQGAGLQVLVNLEHQRHLQAERAGRQAGEVGMLFNEGVQGARRAGIGQATQP